MTAFNRFRPAMFAFFLGGMMMAFVFGLRFIASDTPLSVDIYGPWLSAIPAQAWVALQFVITGGAAMACAFERPRIAAAFSILLALYLTVFAALAVSAGPSGTIVTSGAGFWLAPLAVMAAAVSWWGHND